MASKIELTAISEKDQKKIKDLPALEVIETKWPQKEMSAADARAALKNWQEKLPEPKPPKNPEIAIRAVEPTATALSKLTAVVNSEAAPAELLTQKLDEKSLLGTIYSAVTTYQFMQMQSDYKTRSASARTRKEAEAQWPETVSGFQRAFSSAGLSGVSEAKLSQYAKQLASNQRNLNAVAQIVNSAVKVEELPAAKAPSAPKGVIVPQVAKFINLTPITNIIPNLCSSPIVQGTFTRHFGNSFALTVGLNAPCFPKVWKTCWYQYTIASVSFGLDINVGYQVNCCGATAWGQAVAQACASIVGKTFCASCTGKIAGVAGFSKSSAAGGKCLYGLAFLASLECKFGGSTIFSASAPFGYTITGPCPLPGIKC